MREEIVEGEKLFESFQKIIDKYGNVQCAVKAM
jgi:hypothetical protein